jgi:hypothetical protein
MPWRILVSKRVTDDLAQESLWQRTVISLQGDRGPLAALLLHRLPVNEARRDNRFPS